MTETADLSQSQPEQLHVRGLERATNATIGLAVMPLVAARRLAPHTRTGLYYTGLAALTAVGAIELPVAGAIAAGVWVARNRAPRD